MPTSINLISKNPFFTFKGMTDIILGINWDGSTGAKW